ncbi:hypothetical protein [Nisaea sp.]
MLPLDLGPNRNCAEGSAARRLPAGAKDVITWDSSTDLTGELMQFSGLQI